MPFTPSSVAKTEAAFLKAAAKLEAAKHPAENAGARAVAKRMQAAAPAKTGNLRGSIQAEGSYAAANAPYAIPVDKGHGSYAGVPFAEQGALKAVPEVVTAVTAVFRTALGGR